MGTTVIPGLNVAAKAGTSITTAVVSQAVRDYVSAQGKDLDALGQTLYKLAMPEGAGNSAAAEAFKVNALEVRGQ